MPQPVNGPAPDKVDQALEAARAESELHSLVARAERSLRAAKANEKGILRPRAKRIASIDVSRGSLERALEALSVLIRVLEALGARVWVDPDQNPKLRLAVLGEELGLSLEEKISAHRYVPKPRDKEIPRYMWPRYDYSLTGQLTIRVHGHLPWGFRTSWQDRKVQRVERILGKIITGVFAAAEAQKQKRIDDEQQRRKWAEWQRLDEEERRLRRLERQRERHVERLAEQYERWARLTDFLEVVENHRDSLSATHIQGVPIITWIAWAKGYAARLDPITDPDCWNIDKQVPLWKVD